MVLKTSVLLKWPNSNGPNAILYHHPITLWINLQVKKCDTPIRSTVKWEADEITWEPTFHITTWNIHNLSSILRYCSVCFIDIFIITAYIALRLRHLSFFPFSFLVNLPYNQVVKRITITVSMREGKHTGKHSKFIHLIHWNQGWNAVYFSTSFTFQASYKSVTPLNG